MELLLDNSPLLEDCLSCALLAAVMCDNPSNVGMLIIKGASNVKEAIKLAAKECKHNAHAMLLLMMAAINNDCDLVQALYKEHNIGNEFQNVQKALSKEAVSTLLPLEVACRWQNKAVAEELLLRTDVYLSEGIVHWHGLGLNVIENTLLCKIGWAKTLDLGRNKLLKLPSEINLHLKNVGEPCAM